MHSRFVIREFTKFYYPRITYPNTLPLIYNVDIQFLRKSFCQKIPMEPPVKPSESDCCNSGCSPCILDVYEEQLKKYKAATQVSRKSTTNCLSLTSFSIFRLVNIEKHTKDVNLYTFEFIRPEKLASSPKKASSVLYEPGQYLILKAQLEGEQLFQSPYTPVFIENQSEKCFSVLVKLYENGKMSKYYNRLFIGSETAWRGPYGDYVINYDNKFLLFIAQGTGVAPFYSIICNMLNNEQCETFLTLFFCCNFDNLILRDKLYKLQEYWNFKCELFISGCNEKNFQKKYNETVHFSRLDLNILKNYLENVKGDVKVLICGAETFCNNIRDSLEQCGVPLNHITVF